MLQVNQYFEYSDQSRKMEILTRLVKEGAITLEEAFLLNEKEVVQAPYVPSMNPYWITSTPGTGTYTIPNGPSTCTDLKGSITSTTVFNPENTSWSYTN